MQYQAADKCRRNPKSHQSGVNIRVISTATHCALKDDSTRHLSFVAFLVHPMERDIQGLSFHEVWDRQIMDEMVAHAIEKIDGSDVENLGLPIADQ